jgi:Transposase
MRWAARQQLLSPPDPSSRRGQNQQARQAQSEQAVAPLRTRRVAWWLLRRPDTLSTGHQAVLARMEQASPAFGQLYRLTVQFTEMLRNRQVEQLRPWLEAAKASDLRELKSLAEGMERDNAAIEAALRLPYSTEHVAYCTSSPASSRFRIISPCVAAVDELVGAETNNFPGHCSVPPQSAPHDTTARPFALALPVAWRAPPH